MLQSPHRLRNDLKCVEWDVKPCTTNLMTTLRSSAASITVTGDDRTGTSTTGCNQRGSSSSSSSSSSSDTYTWPITPNRRALSNTNMSLIRLSADPAIRYVHEPTFFDPTSPDLTNFWADPTANHKVMTRPDQLKMTPKVEFSKHSGEENETGRAAKLNIVNWTLQRWVNMDKLQSL